MLRSSLRPRNALGVLLFAVACGLPRDPDRTLERVRGGVVRIGVAESRPWVIVTPTGAEGVEPVLAKAIADSLGATIEWIRKSESELLTDLSERKLDLVIGGLTHDSPWKTKIALTKPFYEDPRTKKKHVMAAPPGENAWLVFVERQLRRHQHTIPALVRSAT
ncbi:MAG TPA: transporter substrate-binding domain-containing protein [Gemmatimonadaceae bacterium]|nr:transporter substrate-binding domain-containing protein [Gemmatimonadaceae bacterium]